MEGDGVCRQKGNLRNDGKMCGGVRFHLFDDVCGTCGRSASSADRGCFRDCVSDRGVRYSAGARHGNRAASVGGDCVCRRQCQNGNRGHGAVSDHHGGAQHCGTEAGGKTDGALAGCDAAVHDSRASLFRNPWTVRSAASGIVFEKTLQRRLFF